MIGGSIVAFCFIGFIFGAFIVLSPGLFLYYLSIKMGIDRLRQNVAEHEGQFDENGMRIIDATFIDETPEKKKGIVKKSITWIRDFLNKYAE